MAVPGKGSESVDDILDPHREEARESAAIDTSPCRNDGCVAMPGAEASAKRSMVFGTVTLRPVAVDRFG